MPGCKEIARNLLDLFFGGNWTSVNLKEVLNDVDRTIALRKVEGLNTIAALVNHIDWYVTTITKVVMGATLEGTDKMSWEHLLPATESQWAERKKEVFSNAQVLVAAIENLDDAILDTVFGDAKYGSYFRNLVGLIEHTHYHLGQIVIIKKLAHAN